MKWKSLLVMGALLLSTTMSFGGIDISGTVTDSDGKGIEGVSVRLAIEEENTTTDEDGYFEIVTTPVANELAQSSSISISDNNLRVSSLAQSVSVELYSLNGQLTSALYDGKAISNIALNTTDIANGMYVMSIVIDGKTNIIKQHLYNGKLSGISGNSLNGETRTLRATDTLIFEKEGFETIKKVVDELVGTFAITLKAEGNNDIPSGFTKKVLMEETTGTWCGYCPYGAKAIKDLTEQYPNRFIGVAIHGGDPMQISKGQSLISRFGGSGYPSCVIDRGAPLHPGNSPSVVAGMMNEDAICGLSIDASVDGEVTVKAGFLEDITGDIRITIYLLESGVANTGSYKQSDYNNVLWPGFTHDHILTEVLTGFLGSKIEAKAGTTVTKKFTYDLSNTVSGDKANCAIVALINKVGSTYAGDEVYNSQEVHVGEVKDFD